MTADELRLAAQECAHHFRREIECREIGRRNLARDFEKMRMAIETFIVDTIGHDDDMFKQMIQEEL